VVEHSPLQPKVEGLSSASATGIWRWRVLGTVFNF